MFGAVHVNQARIVTISSSTPSLSSDNEGNVDTPSCESRAQRALFSQSWDKEQSLLAETILERCPESGSETDSDTEELARTCKLLGNNNNNNQNLSVAKMSTGRFGTLFTLTTDCTVDQLDAGRVSVP